MVKPIKKKEKIFFKFFSIPVEDIFLFEDECSLSNTATIAYAWDVKGTQAQIAQKQKNKERVTLFGAVNPATGEVIAKQSQRGNPQSFKKVSKENTSSLQALKRQNYNCLRQCKVLPCQIIETFFRKA